MLTPAIQAYGVGVVSVLIVFLVACLVVLAVDYRRWTSHQRAAAKRRHPAAGANLAPTARYQGRHRAPIPRPLDAGLRPIHRGRPS